MNLQIITGDFSFILFVSMVVTGIIWCLDVFFLVGQRRWRADMALAEYDAGSNKLCANVSATKPDASRLKIEAALLRRPTWVEYSGGFFPVISMIFVLRSFFFEPFGIPSSSMLPTLHSGDLVLVNKFTYGIRLPIINKKVIEVNDPQRGDVVVFRYPRDISQNFVKRIIGVPGDHITYQDKRLTVNGQTTAYTPLNDYWVPAVDVFKQLSENLAGVQHRVLNTKGTPTLNLSGVYDFAHKDACSYLQDGSGFTCMVPAENYFMMGDNRDHSADSRYWGFVPDKNIVGKAFFVWMTLGKLSHIGSIE